MKRCIPNLDLGSIRLDDRSLVSSIPADEADPQAVTECVGRWLGMTTDNQFVICLLKDCRIALWKQFGKKYDENTFHCVPVLREIGFPL